MLHDLFAYVDVVAVVVIVVDATIPFHVKAARSSLSSGMPKAPSPPRPSLSCCTLPLSPTTAPGLSLSIADQTNALADLRLEGAQAPQAQAQLTLRGSKYQQTTVSSAP